MISKWVLLILLAGISLLAEANVDDGSVDVHRLVQNQITEAREKAKEVPVVKRQAAVKQAPIVQQKSEASSSSFSPFEVKMVILGLFSSVILLFVGVRRMKNSEQKVRNIPAQEFKKNIQLVRAEKFIKPIDPKLKKIRTNLYLNTRYLNEANSSVSETAKKLNIAKTELILAARFNRQGGSQPFVAKPRSMSHN